MAAWQTIHRPDETFLLSEATGFRSRGTVTLKAGAVYDSGSVLAAEAVGGIPTGFYSLSDGTASSAVILCRRTDTTDGAVDVGVIESDAEVKRNELSFKAGLNSAGVLAVLADLAANGIKAR